MAIDQRFIEELTAKADIIDVISNYMSLKKSGSNYFGLCPFHGEKTPSFSASADKQIFRCFGCGEGGSAVGFIMKIEGLEYVDAIRFLAKMYNMEVVETKNFKGPDNSKLREKIHEMNKHTARFFYENLNSSQNAFAKQYLVDRNMSKKVITDFGVGYANSSFNDLINHLENKGFTQQEMLTAGLISKNDKGNVYDKFRGRIMFPIIDIRGNIIAFGGRVIDDSMPKYLNSPETLVFNKSNNLFAMNIAKKSKRGYIILAEGYMDVIALHQAGFDCAVASLGTSLTDGQARILMRYTNDVVIAYDSDNAGQSASNRAIDILKKVGLNIKVLQMKNAKDPDEYIKNFGVTSFANLIENSENDTQYKFDKIVAKYNLEIDGEKIECIKEIIGLLIKLYSNIEREIFIVKTAEKTGISKDAITLEFKNHLKKVEKTRKTKEKRETLSPIGLIKPKNREIVYQDIKSARAEEEIIAFVFTDCTLLDKIELDKVMFSVEMFKKVYEKARKMYEDGKQINVSNLDEMLEQSEITHLVEIISRPQAVVNRQEAVISLANTITERYAHKTGDMNLILELKKKSRGK